MRWTWWALVLLAIGIADFAVRWTTGFDMAWVIRAEAVLFLGASAALALLHRRWPAEGRWQSRLHHVLVAALALAGLRAALWALGLPVARANLTVIGVASILLVAVLVRSRRQRSRVGPRDTTS